MNISTELEHKRSELLKNVTATNEQLIKAQSAVILAQQELAVFAAITKITDTLGVSATTSNNTSPCQYCHESKDKRGLWKHEATCSENPANKKLERPKMSMEARLAISRAMKKRWAKVRRAA